MKNFILFIFVAWSLNVNGQITITQNEMPHAGDDLYRTRANINPFLNYNATGPNHVWNFNNLVANVQDSALYQTVASTNFVYALVYADIFFNPNRANHAIDGVDIPFNNILPIANPYTFYYRSSSIYKKVGYGAELAGIPVPITFSDQDEIYNLPLNFGDNDSTFSAYNISIPTLAHYGYEQSRLNDVDGWGVINTPSGTFDVLRVKTELYGKDSIQIDTLNFGFAIDRPVVTEYKWLAENIRVPILQINTSTIFGIELITDIWFYDVPRSVEVLQPLASVFCPGDTIDVTYDATGVFNSGGLFNPANIFRAQLSDLSGDFSNPINIGSLTSTQSGVISAVIPANTPPGNGYRIRVISTNPAFTGDDNGFDISIGEAPVANISAVAPLEFCEGSSVLLTADTNVVYTYQWQLNGIDIAGADSYEYLAADAGDYTVVITNSCGDAVSNVLTVIVNELPEHTFSQNSVIGCDGIPVTITSSNNTGQLNLTYQWFLNGSAIAGETNSDITTADPGDYTLEITNQVTGCMFSTNVVNLSIDSIAPPVLAANGSTQLCEGDSVLIDINSMPGLTYQWLVDGIVIPGAVGTSIYASFPGNYTAIATNTNGCEASSASSVPVAVFPLPLTPVLNVSGAVSFCNGDSVVIDFLPEAGVSYQWQLDGIDIPGATSTSYVALISGIYSVTASGANGCNALAVPSVTITVSPLPLTPVLTASGSLTFCQGDSVILDFMPEPNVTYQWQLDGIDIAGATGTSIIANTAGVYAVIATNPAGCASISTGTTVLVNPLPADPQITANGSTTFCDGGNVILETPLVSGYMYQWSLNNVNISGANSNTYTVSTGSGNYSVSIIDLNGCAVTSATSQSVLINPLPAAPLVTQSYDSLFATGIGQFQWYLNGTAIAGANDSFYIVLINGDYTVTVTDTNGCENISVIYPFNSVGISEYELFNVSVYPNPSSGIFTVNFNNPNNELFYYELTELQGKIVGKGSVKGNNLVIDLTESSNSIYFIRLYKNNGSVNRKIIKQ